MPASRLAARGTSALVAQALGVGLLLVAGLGAAAADGDTAPVPATHAPASGSPAATLPVRLVAPALLVPQPTRALPAALDARPTYRGAVSCDPVERPGAVAVGRLLSGTYGVGTFGIARYCAGGTSEHHEGRAIDWMFRADDPAQDAVARSALAWLTGNNGEMARRLGVMYLIYDRKMWRAYDPAGAWKPYTGASPHTDHIHISLTWDGALQRTSWWTGQPVTAPDLGPCRVYAGQPAPIYSGRNTGGCAPDGSLPAAPASAFPLYAIGAKHANVATAQRALGVTADGAFGTGTRAAVLAYQARVGLPRTGVLDKATWARLVPGGAPAGAAAPATTPSTTTPSTTTPSTTTPPTQQSATSTPGTAGRTGALPVPAAPVAPYAPFKAVRLGPGSRGMTVRTLQSGLRLPRTGTFDARTTAAVRALQARWRIPVTGRVDLRTWNRIELENYPWLAYTGTSLRRGSRGPAVVALQRALKVSADGAFGARTAAAVTAVQARYGLPTTGVLDGPTWRAVSAAALR